MKKFLKVTSVFLSCVAIFMILLLSVQDPEFIVGRKKIFLEDYSARNYDLLVVGSSRAEHTFKPDIYNGQLKIFNAGEEGHGMPSNYLLIKVLLEKHHLHIDKLLLQVDEFSLDGNNGFSRQFRDDYFVTDLDDPEVFNAFKLYRGTFFAYIIKIFPSSANLIYSDFRKFLKNQALAFRKWNPAINKIYLDHIRQAEVSKGYKPLEPAKHVTTRLQRFSLENDDLQYFRKLISLCQKNHIRLYFYRAPILDCQLVQSAPFDAFISNFTSTHKVPFYDYKCRYQWPSQYEDQNHSADSISSIMTRDVLREMRLMGE